jgi:hypothetical protein
MALRFKNFKEWSDYSVMLNLINPNVPKNFQCVLNAIHAMSRAGLLLGISFDGFNDTMTIISVHGAQVQNHERTE